MIVSTSDGTQMLDNLTWLQQVLYQPALSARPGQAGYTADVNEIARNWVATLAQRQAVAASADLGAVDYAVVLSYAQKVADLRANPSFIANAPVIGTQPDGMPIYGAFTATDRQMLQDLHDALVKKTLPA